MPSREPPDPLDAALQPPSDETPEQRLQRLAHEAEARRISNEIDEDIKRERALRKKKQIVKVLLLGQSESGLCFSPCHTLLPSITLSLSVVPSPLRLGLSGCKETATARPCLSVRQPRPFALFCHQRRKSVIGSWPRLQASTADSFSAGSLLASSIDASH